MHPIRNGVVNEKVWCMYEYSAYDPVSLGVQMPNPFSDPRENAAIIEKMQNAFQCHAGSPTMAAVQLLIVWTMAAMIAPFTLDYFTLLLLLLVPVFSSLLLRIWLPFTCRSVIFTENILKDGYDNFVVYNSNPGFECFEPVTIDLYSWIHMQNLKRQRYLFVYCRSVMVDDVDAKYTQDGFQPQLDAELEFAKGKRMAARHHKIHDTWLTDMFCNMSLFLCSYLSFIHGS